MARTIKRTLVFDIKDLGGGRYFVTIYHFGQRFTGVMTNASVIADWLNEADDKATARLRRFAEKYICSEILSQNTIE